MAKSLKEIEKEISKTKKAIEKYNKKEEKDGSLSNVDANTRNAYQKLLDKRLAEKESILNGGSKTTTPKKVDNTTSTNAPAVNKPTNRLWRKAQESTQNLLNERLAEKESIGGSKTIIPAQPKKVDNTPASNAPAASVPAVNKPITNNTLEKGLEKVEEKAQGAADEMNSEEEKNNKTEDAKSAAETARDMAAQVDANVEENIPTWFWREAQEMAPSDKAKQGFIISNYILNRLGTAAGNIGAIIQNAGGSGGATLKEHGGSYIDQYRKSKLEQAMTNRKTRQNNLLQQQIDALVAIGASENEARAIQNKLRNSKYWNKYNRLTNEQQIYIQGLLYSDTKGEITDAVLGDFIDRIMNGKDISLNNVAATALTAAGIDNVDKLTSGAGTIGEKVTNWLAGAAGWKKPGE